MNSFALVNRSGKMDTRNKSCADCHTTRTPLWRGGPAGPRVSHHPSYKFMDSYIYIYIDIHIDNTCLVWVWFCCFCFGIWLQSLCNACGIRYRKKRRVVLGVNRDQRGEKSQRKKSKDGVSFKLGEEEQAAFLLMALSCSSVFCA